MVGLLFYWLFWIGWILTTFFYPKTHPDRLKVSAWILVTILLSAISLKLNEFELSGSGAFILLTVYVYVSYLEKKKGLYFLLTSFILMLTTVCFLLFEVFDPVWILIKREWLLSILVTYVAVFLHSDKKQRILAMMLGMIQGEILYALILIKYSFIHPVAALASLDVVALASAILITWNSLELMTSYFSRHWNTVEKEKQKLI